MKTFFYHSLKKRDAKASHVHAAVFWSLWSVVLLPPLGNKNVLRFMVA